MQRGDPVLRLHSGPGLPWTSLQPLVDELADGSLVAAVSSAGWPPSTDGPPSEGVARAPARFPSAPGRFVHPG
jgi:hypothetical protein